MKHATRSRWLQEPEVIGFTRKGTPVFSQAGGAEDGGAGEDEDTSQDGDEEEDDEEDEDERDEEDKDSGKGKGAQSGTEPVSRDEYENLLERMKAADRRASKAEKKVKEAERKERSELENLQSDLEETSTERDTLRTENQNLQVRLAVVTSTEAKKFLDNSDVLLNLKDADLTDDDGNVDSKKVDAALKDLAQRKPHLLTKASDDDEDEEEEERPPSGAPFNQKKGKKGSLDRATLARKYPALR